MTRRRYIFLTELDKDDLLLEIVGGQGQMKKLTKKQIKQYEKFSEWSKRDLVDYLYEK